MRDPRDYLSEIDANLRKIQAQGQVTATENALFGMIDGLAGLQRTLLERVTLLEARVGTAPITREPEPLTETPASPPRRAAGRRGPDTRNATVNPDGSGAPPIPVEPARSGRASKFSAGPARDSRQSPPTVVAACDRTIRSPQPSHPRRHQHLRVARLIPFDRAEGAMYCRLFLSIEL